MNKKILFFLLPLLCFLLAAPEEAASASANGVNLWFHTVLPTLLPFIILSDLLISGGASFSLPERADRICRLLTGFSSAGCYILALGFLRLSHGRQSQRLFFPERAHIGRRSAAPSLSFQSGKPPVSSGIHCRASSGRGTAPCNPWNLLWHCSASALSFPAQAHQPGVCILCPACAKKRGIPLSGRTDGCLYYERI